MSLQYDKIGNEYEKLTEIGIGAVQVALVKEHLGDIKGLTILDLACGVGKYTQIMADMGAKKVIGSDISASMIDAAKERSSDTRVEYRVDDCSKPLDFCNGQFDLVTGFWFLNYAPDDQTLKGMFQNIVQALRPGGRFLGIASNPSASFSASNPHVEQYNISFSYLRKVEHGFQALLKAHTEPPVQFENYHLDGAVYLKCAAEAGLHDFQFIPRALPREMPDGVPPAADEYWHDFLTDAVWSLCTGTRGS